jgi:hypothetical protein
MRPKDPLFAYVYQVKVTRDTNLWKKGQKLWVIFHTGALAAYCAGRYRGKGRWIRAWAHWADREGIGFFQKPDSRYVGKIKVSRRFYDDILKKHEVIED